LFWRNLDRLVAIELAVITVMQICNIKLTCDMTWRGCLISSETHLQISASLSAIFLSLKEEEHEIIGCNIK